MAKSTLFVGAALLATLGLSGFGGHSAARLVEARISAQAAQVLAPEDSWLTLVPDGAILQLTGEAPGELAHTAALARLGAAGLGVRLDDHTTVGPAEGTEAAPPNIAAARLDILINDGAMTLFGDVPTRDLQRGSLADLAQQPRVSDMLVPLDGTAAPGWADALNLALEAATLIDRGQITAGPDHVKVEGTARSDSERLAAITTLEAAAPKGVKLTLDLAAPRPVISPFVFAAKKGEGAVQVTACTLSRPEDLAILAAKDVCRVGLGAPSPDWAGVVQSTLATLEALGGGTVDIRDVDITLTGPVGMNPEAFEAAVADLTDALPQLYSLTASLPVPPQAQSDPALAPAKFTAVRTEDGAVRLRGDLLDTRLRETAQAFAEAHFGFDTVINETTAREDLPTGWSTQVVAGLEALGMLSTGQLAVTESGLSLTGTAPSLRVKDDLRAALARKLPSTVNIALDVWEAEVLRADPVVQVPAELCAEQISILLEGGQIVFPPSETEIAEESLPIIDRIAEILGYCPGARFEIAGHTDSQGRESSNMALSQSRADAVLAAVLERGVDLVFLTARGYGETSPIATNETEQGRALNRRISFELAPKEAVTTPQPSESPIATAPEAGTLVTRAAQSPLDGIEEESGATPTDAPPTADPDLQDEEPQAKDTSDVMRPLPRPTPSDG